MADVMAQTPPILHGPSEKERKYDRQLRLWAAQGQAALESANILLVNSGCGTVGIETLKNLVLPGWFPPSMDSLIDLAPFLSVAYLAPRHWQIHYRRSSQSWG